MYNYSEMLDTITTSSGSKVTIENKGYIGKIVTGEGSHTVIDNNGKIGTINTGIGSTTIISNSGEIGIINTGKESHTSIENKKESKIREIETGDSNKDKKTRTYIENSGTIDKIITGIESENYIEDYGTIKGVTTGKGNNTYYSSKNGIEFTKGADSKVIKLTPEELRALKGTIGLESIDAKYKWLPPMPIDFDSSTAAAIYFRKYEKAFTKLHWDQDKINALWEATYDINEQYGIQIDPRLLLAVIIQEGTGSFNTSSTNRAADGQHGVETNYVVDLMKANSLIFGKTLGYIYYGEEFRQAVSANNDKAGIDGPGDIFQYYNWNTPIIDTRQAKVRMGPYAGHGAWGYEVKKHYTALGGEAIGYENYISSIDKSSVDKITKDLGIKLPTYSFVPEQNAQNSLGKFNGKWTIRGK